MRGIAWGARCAYGIFFKVREEFFRSAHAAQDRLRRGFFNEGRVAQLAEHSALNRQVVGSIPTASTKFPVHNSS